MRHSHPGRQEARTFRRDRGIRRFRSEDYTDFVLRNPGLKRRLDAALERSRAGLSFPLDIDRLIAEFGLGEEE